MRQNTPFPWLSIADLLQHGGYAVQDMEPFEVDLEHPPKDRLEIVLPVIQWGTQQEERLVFHIDASTDRIYARANLGEIPIVARDTKKKAGSFRWTFPLPHRGEGALKTPKLFLSRP